MQSTLIQTTVQEPETQPVPEQELQSVAAAIAKDKGVTTKGIGCQNPLDLGGEAIKT
jgi:hypothetical protein